MTLTSRLVPEKMNLLYPQIPTCTYGTTYANRKATKILWSQCNTQAHKLAQSTFWKTITPNQLNNGVDICQ